MITRRRLMVGAGTVALAAILGVRFRPAAAETFEVTHSDAEWRKLLTPDQYAVLRAERDRAAVHAARC